MEQSSVTAAGRGPRTGTPRWGYPSHRCAAGPFLSFLAADGYTVPQATAGSLDCHQFKYWNGISVCPVTEYATCLEKGGALITSVLFCLKCFRRTKLFIQDNRKGSQCENSRIAITQRHARILCRLICISTSGTLSVRPSRYCLKPTDMFFRPSWQDIYWYWMRVTYCVVGYYTN